MAKTLLGSKTICTIGGGSGMPVVNKALILAGATKICSIVSTFDSGGDTGRIRTDERGQVLAFSDYWRSLISLWPDCLQKNIWEEFLLYRDGRKRNFGNTFFQFMSEKVGNLTDVDKLFGQLTGAKVRGKVVPISLKPADIYFKTESGRVYKGEHFFDELRMSSDLVKDVWLNPGVKANPLAIKLIKKADLIINCPGSIFGSLVANFLPVGTIGAYKQSKARKILISNIMSITNENVNRTIKDYINIFEKKLNIKKPFDLIISPNLKFINQKQREKIMKLYACENSYPLRLGRLKNVETLRSDIVKIDQENFRLRHDPQKLAHLFLKIDLFQHGK